MRAFPVVLPSGSRYWTVIDDDLNVVPAVDHWLRYLRFGRSRAELTSKAHAGGAALYLRWCRETGRHWPEGARDLGLFMVWLKYTPSRPPAGAGMVLLGPGAEPARRERRVNAVLAAVRGLLTHAVSLGEAPRSALSQIYELGDSRDLPLEAQGEEVVCSTVCRSVTGCRSRRRMSTVPRTKSSWQCSWPAVTPGIGSSSFCWAGSGCAAARLPACAAPTATCWPTPVCWAASTPVPTCT